MSRLIVAIAAFGLLAAAAPSLSFAQNPGPERRIAFVVGNESYADGALPTGANDAGLIAQTLQAAGFEVSGARDLDAETLRQSYADFLKSAADAGPDTVAFVYLSGYGLQYGKDTYYVPIGAKVSRDVDIPIAAIRLSDLAAPLNALKLKARFMVVDAAYTAPFSLAGAPLAGGLSLVEPTEGSLAAYNAAPGTVAPVGKGSYGLYAQSLASELREGGLPPEEIFDRVRLRVNDESKGAQTPWYASKVDPNFRFFERDQSAPAPVTSPAETAALTRKPLKDLPVRQAYVAAVARDTVQSYSEFTSVYASDPLAKRARVLLAARREAMTWYRSSSVDTPAAYWSYLDRYPHGPHAGAARLRLGELSAAFDPPPEFPVIAYDVPPPPPDELGIVDQPVIDFDDPVYDLAPPPSPPDYWLPPVPIEFADLPPPPSPDGLFFLPVPDFVPLPIYYNPPPFVAYPYENRFFGGLGRDRGRVGLRERGVVSGIHRPILGGGPGARPFGVALPGPARQRATIFEKRGITTPAQLSRQQPGGSNAASGRKDMPLERRLPGTNGQPLPGIGRPGVPDDRGEGRRAPDGRGGRETPGRERQDSVDPGQAERRRDQNEFQQRQRDREEQRQHQNQERQQRQGQERQQRQEQERQQREGQERQQRQEQERQQRQEQERQQRQEQERQQRREQERQQREGQERQQRQGQERQQRQQQELQRQGQERQQRQQQELQRQGQERQQRQQQEQQRQGQERQQRQQQEQQQRQGQERQQRQQQEQQQRQGQDRQQRQDERRQMRQP